MSKLHTIFLTLAMMVCATVASAERWSVERMNEVVNQTNFIVGAGCSGTLISLKYRLILTNHHCITAYISHVNRERVKDGTVKKVRLEELRDVVVSQKTYANYRRVGSAAWQTVIVARWKESDLALLQFRANLIPHSVQSDIYSGKNLMRGETAIAVGNPLGLDATITKGIVSSVNRMFRVSWADNQEVPFIQIDSGITGGNSGGALYNDHGELIGVPAAGARVGHIGLAIPYTQIQKFLTDNCYRDVWDKGKLVATHDACMETRKKAKEKKADRRAGSSSRARIIPAEFTAAIHWQRPH